MKQYILVVLCLFGYFSIDCAAAENPARPNIVLIMADDLGYSDLGCYGSEIQTPNLDQLAKDGLRFTQFYNCAVCVTTRAALLTGLHPRRRNRGLLHQDMTTLAEVLKSAGYRTSLTGKWHLGNSKPNRPTDRGFEEYYGLADGCSNFFFPTKPDPQFYNGGKVRTFLHNEKKITDFPADFYATDAFTDHAVKQIESNAKADAPFFLHLCYTAPHFPLHAKPADIAKYQGRYTAGYFKLREQRFERMMKLGLIQPSWKLSPPDHQTSQFRYDYNITPWDKVADLQRENRRMEVYAGMVDSLDQGVGRVLAAIKKSGIEDNTIVMFLSDNGGCASLPGYWKESKRKARQEYNRELPGGIDTYDFVAPGWGWAQCTPFRRFKVWTYEGGISTPLIVRWPSKIKANSITHQVGHIVDFMPTFMELSGAKYPDKRKGQTVPSAEGLSLVPILSGKEREGHKSLCWFLYGNRAVREGRWKLVWGADKTRWELYDMQVDRTETNNLASQYPERVERMKKNWLNWARQTGAPLTGNQI